MMPLPIFFDNIIKQLLSVFFGGITMMSQLNVIINRFLFSICVSSFFFIKKITNKKNNLKKKTEKKPETFLTLVIKRGLKFTLIVYGFLFYSKKMM